MGVQRQTYESQLLEPWYDQTESLPQVIPSGGIEPSGGPIVSFPAIPPPPPTFEPAIVVPMEEVIAGLPGASVGTAPTAEPGASIPGVLQPPVPGREPIVLGRPTQQMIVKHDIRNPGKYVIYTDDNQILQNSSAEFVRALGLQVPDPLLPTITEDDDAMGFDLGDILTDVAKTVLPRWAEEAIGITQPGTPLMAPQSVLAPQTGGGMIIPPSGGPPGIPPNYGARRREPTWHYDGWSFKDGQWVRRRRRRRRKLLTEGDYNSLLKIQTLKNTDNIKIALSKALR